MTDVPSSTPASAPRDLSRYAWLSIGAAVLTIVLKVGAYEVTAAVSLLSDAMESVVNLVAALVALIALKMAARPANEQYTFGRSKAEYFSAAIEGAMIFGAAALIIFAAVERLFIPVPVGNLGIGIVISLIAGLVNAGTGIVLFRAGKKYSSPTLTADAKHLFTDIVTSIGVVIGVAAVWVTGWTILDPLVAIAVAINIVFVGISLMRESMRGLLDATLPDEDNQLIIDILRERSVPGTISFHGLQTRAAGRECHIKMDAQVPGEWTVRQGHDFAEQVVSAIRQALPQAHVSIHVEPIEDPESYRDIPEGFIPLGDDDGFVAIDIDTGYPRSVQQ
ncbi:MAG: cation transporter [Actinomycetaceae bacterium]|nr:cation transporter [Actinomycetaceae bacterium]